MILLKCQASLGMAPLQMRIYGKICLGEGFITGFKRNWASPPGTGCSICHVPLNEPIGTASKELGGSQGIIQKTGKW